MRCSRLDGILIRWCRGRIQQDLMANILRKRWWIFCSSRSDNYGGDYFMVYNKENSYWTCHCWWIYTEIWEPILIFNRRRLRIYNYSLGSRGLNHMSRKLQLNESRDQCLNVKNIGIRSRFPLTTTSGTMDDGLLARLSLQHLDQFRIQDKYNKRN